MWLSSIGLNSKIFSLYEPSYDRFCEHLPDESIDIIIPVDDATSVNNLTACLMA